MSKFFKALEQAERDSQAPKEGRPAVEREPTTAPEPLAEPVSVAEPEPVFAAAAATPSPTPRLQERDGAPRDIPAEVVRPVTGVDDHLVSLTAPTSFEAEQYRSLRNFVEGRATAGQCYVVSVSSPSKGDGKTMTAINLAGALAQAEGSRVLLIDADLRASSIARQLSMANYSGAGLVEAVRNPDLSLDEVVKPTGRPNLWVVPCGRIPRAPYEILSSPRLARLIDEARARYDYVIVDTPPLLPIADCRLIARCVDGILVVVAAHRTPRKLVEESIREVEAAKVLGFVFNSAENTPLGDYYYGPHTGNGHVEGHSRLRKWLGRR